MQVRCIEETFPSDAASLVRFWRSKLAHSSDNVQFWSCAKNDLPSRVWTNALDHIARWGKVRAVLNIRTSDRFIFHKIFPGRGYPTAMSQPLLTAGMAASEQVEEKSRSLRGNPVVGMTEFPLRLQGEHLACLPIGTQVSAKYKGAFCEAKVRSVVKQVKVRLTFKNGLGTTQLSSEYVKPPEDGSLMQPGSVVSARHPDKQEYLEATVNKVIDQSQYTVVFDDGDITQLRRNALCMKSGKHFSASESLGNGSTFTAVD